MKKTLLFALLASAPVLISVQSSVSQTKSDSDTEYKPTIVALKPGEPDTRPFDAGTIRFLVSGDDTHGAWALLEETEMPGFKTRWHRHNHMDEAFYVLEGVLTAKIADKTYELPAGSYILIPRGTPHGQANLGSVPVKLLLTLTPAGFERVFRERVELFKTVKPDDPEFTKKFQDLRGKYPEYVEVLGTWDVGK